MGMGDAKADTADVPPADRKDAGSPMFINPWRSLPKSINSNESERVIVRQTYVIKT